MKIGVFCQRDDTTALEVARVLNHLEPGCCTTYPLNAIPEQAITLTDSTLRWNDVELTSMDAAWIGAYPYRDPVVPFASGPTEWSRWQFDHLLEQQRYSAIESLFAELERRGVQVLNGRRFALAEFSKPEWLLRLGRAGCGIPRLLCSNDVGDVDAFCNRFQSVLWRPATGRAAWQRFTVKQKRHLVGTDKPPILLAEAVSDAFLLAWCLDGEAILCVAIEPPGTRPVESLGNPDDFGELLRFETLEILTVVDARQMSPALGRLYDACGRAGWMAATLMQRDDGEFTAYDLDTDPDLSWLPMQLRNWLLSCLAYRLLGRNRDPGKMPEGGLKLQRPALFLRRMLQIQYDMEDSKYPTGDE